MPSSTPIIIDSLINDPNTTQSERHILQCMKAQATLSDADLDWICALTRRRLKGE